MPNLRCYDQVADYLTIEAIELLYKLQELGIDDRDLAITIIETLLPDNMVYELDPPEELPAIWGED